jgi:hypothetical protein
VAVSPSGSNTSGSPIGGAVTVGTAAQAAIPPNPGRNALWLWNNSSAGTITVCPCTQWSISQGAASYPAFANTSAPGVINPITQGVPVVNGPGSITIVPGQSVLIDSMNLAGAWNGIGSQNGLSLTVLEGV